jgi:anti-sigma factor RsiW
MDCPKTEILLNYSAGALDAARAAEVARHVEACADCRRVVEVWQTLDHWTPPAVSRDFDTRLYARIAEENAAPVWRRWALRIFQPAIPVAIWKPAVSLAAACAVLAVGLVVRTPSPTDQTKQVRVENVDIEQVANALDDLEILTPKSAM